MISDKATLKLLNFGFILFQSDVKGNVLRKLKSLIVKVSYTNLFCDVEIDDN